VTIIYFNKRKRLQTKIQTDVVTNTGNQKHCLAGVESAPLN